MDFKNSMDVLNYFADQCGVFKPVRDDFSKLKDINENITKELVNTKLEAMKFKEQNVMIIKELADTKVKIAQALNNKLNILGGK